MVCQNTLLRLIPMAFDFIYQWYRHSFVTLGLTQISIFRFHTYRGIVTAVDSSINICFIILSKWPWQEQITVLQLMPKELAVSLMPRCNWQHCRNKWWKRRAEVNHTSARKLCNRMYCISYKTFSGFFSLRWADQTYRATNISIEVFIYHLLYE